MGKKKKKKKSEILLDGRKWGVEHDGGRRRLGLWGGRGEEGKKHRNCHQPLHYTTRERERERKESYKTDAMLTA